MSVKGRRVAPGPACDFVHHYDHGAPHAAKTTNHRKRMAAGRPQEAPVRVGQPHRTATLGGGGGNWPVCSAQDSVEQAYPLISSDEKWVRNWFVRQRSKLAARNRKNQPATEPTFKVQLCYAPAVRSVSTPVPSPPSLESRSPRPSPPTVDTQAIPVSLDNPPTLVPHTATIPTYSRDPLYNRYPDFSQFFRPQVHERFHTFELPTAISNYNHLPTNPNPDPHAPMGLLSLLNPFHLELPTSSTNIQSCPVSFSVRLVDLLAHSSLPQYPIFPPPELGYLV